MDKKGRDSAIDILRGIAILVVVLGHALQSCLGGRQLYVYDVIRNFQMPLFMFISGMALAFSYPDKVCLEFMKARVVRLLPASLIWGYVLYFLRCLIVGETVDIFGIVNVIYVSDFWFLRYLLIYQLIIIGIGCIIKSMRFRNLRWLYYLMPIMAVVLIKFGTYIPVVRNSMSSPLYLWLVAGLLFGKIKNRFSDPILSVIGIVGFGLVVVMTYFHILNAIYTFVVIVVAWWIANEIKRASRVSICLQYIGMRTLPIYAIHVAILCNPLFSIGFYFQVSQKYHMSLVASVSILFLSWTFISLIVEHIISQNKTLSKYIFAKV